MTTISAAIAVYETLLEVGVLPREWPGLTIEATAPLSLTSFALSLLLVFRTNSSYARWQEARCIWGGITNRSRDIVQQALTFVPGNEPELVEMFKRWSIAYSKALMCHLRDDHDVKDELQGVLQPHELDILLATSHKPNYILQVLRGLVESSCIVSPERFRMDQNITFFMDAQGACERILRTPIPLSYTRHTSRFLVIWLSLMPFTLWKSCHWAIIPVSAIVAFLLLGIEEIGVQIEEPFGILALEVMCETIEADLVEMVKNDLTVRKLIGSVNNQGATRIRLENEQAKTKRGNSPGHTDDFLRDNGSNGSRQDFFATPDIPGAEHK